MRTIPLKKIRTGTVFLTLLLIAVTIISCEKSHKQHEDRITEADIKEMKANHIIKLNAAVKQYDKYTKQRSGILKDTLKKKYKDTNFSDTRTVWFDIDDIKAYIQYIEDNSSEAEGLSFYFGVNPDIGKGKNHQTFFIAPTIKNVVNGDTVQSGYTIKNGKRIFIYDAVKEYLAGKEQNIQKANFINLVDHHDDGFLFNEGELNPPGDNN